MHNNSLEQLILSHYKSFAIHTLGCKVNLYESEIITNQLRSIGLIEVDFKSKADIYIINTCSVTNSADAKSRNIIAKANKINPNGLIIVCGCYSQNYYQQIKENLKADIIIGNKYKNDILDLIKQYLDNNKQIVNVKNLMLENQLEFSSLNDFSHKTRAFIKIQDGCNFMCSYCSIPFSRGKQRSVDLNQIIDNIKLLVENNYKEIVLTGVNTAGYLDQNNHNFYDLLCAINNLKGNFRVRISSVEPFQISDEIINLVCLNQHRFSNHWHICLQSGNDQILSLMNRKYSTDEFYQLVNKIYKLSPNACISTDIIVAFPSESQAQFEDSINFIKQCKFAFLHVFPYSKRKYTKAAILKEQIKDNVKKQRMKIMLDLSNQLKTDYLKKFINKEIEVLWEKQEHNIIIGKSSEYCEVYSSNIDKYKVNQIDKVKVIRAFNDKLIVE